MHGRGVEFLDRLLASIDSQSFKDYEICISDHSVNADIAEYLFYCNYKVFYVPNNQNRGSSSANINNAILSSSGDIIKPMFQDDYFYDKDALQIIHDAFNRGVKWMAHGNISSNDTGAFFRHFIPVWNEKIVFGHNTIATPSCIAYLRGKVKFDERLIWLMDCKMYQDLYDEFGLPYIEPKALIVNFLHKDQYTHRMGEAVKRSEEALIREEYKQLTK